MVRTSENEVISTIISTGSCTRSTMYNEFPLLLLGVWFTSDWYGFARKFNWDERKSENCLSRYTVFLIFIHGEYYQLWVILVNQFQNDQWGHRQLGVLIQKHCMGSFLPQ